MIYQSIGSTKTHHDTPVFFCMKYFYCLLFYFQKLLVDFFIDLHAHSTLMNGFMYGNTFDDIERYERNALFPKLLCNNADDFSLANTNFNKDAVKAGTGRR